MPKRVLQGEVVSNKQAKTVVVRVERRFTHPVMKKTVRSSKKYYAHDEKNECAVGDMVKICLLYTSPSPRDRTRSRMPSSA